MEQEVWHKSGEFRPRYALLLPAKLSLGLLSRHEEPTLYVLELHKIPVEKHVLAPVVEALRHPGVRGFLLVCSLLLNLKLFASSICVCVCFVCVCRCESLSVSICVECTNYG